MSINNKLLERRNFLYRAIANKNIDKVQAKEEIQRLDAEIHKNTREILAKEYEKIKTKVEVIKTETTYDGELKRAVAHSIITLLSESLDKETIKGVFRQGYKIMRTRC